MHRFVARVNRQECGLRPLIAVFWDASLCNNQMRRWWVLGIASSGLVLAILARMLFDSW